jgi:hypothetical protein
MLLQGASAEVKRSHLCLRSNALPEWMGLANRSLPYYNRAPFHISCALSSESSWESSCPSLRYR